MEDDAHLRRVFRALLENEGFEVLEARDGVEGMELARTSRPACIITDTMMPRMDGITMLANIRSQGVRVPAILVSAIANLPPPEQLAALGVRCAMGKPFPFEQLMEAVRKACEE